MLSRSLKDLFRHLWLLIPVLLWASPAFAGGVLNPASGNAWELYVFGNGAVVYSILNSVSAMVNDSGYHALMEFVGVLGIFGTAIMVGFDASKMPKMLAFVLGAFFVLYVSLDVTANVMVEDPVNNYTNVATGVPAVVGVPAAVISDVGHWLTEKVEQDFSLPNSLTVTGGDQFNLANSLMQSATQAQILDPYLKSSFAAYVSNCVIPELANGTLNAETILTSTDFFQAIKVNNQAVLTPYYSSSYPNGQLDPCSDVWALLYGDLNSDASSLLTANTSQWGGNGVSIISNGLTSAMTWLSNNTANQSADQTILQTATLNMFNGTAMQEGAALSGNNGLVTSMAVAQAEQSQESSWFTGAQVFNNLMGYIYSVLQAFLFAITPILMAATLIPGFGFTVLKNFFQVLLWLILWQPMLAIISYIVSLYGQSAYGGVLAGSGGITDMNLPVISQQASHMVLAAGFLATMVPIIAWGLVKGSLAFSDFIMAAGGGALASSAGAQAATGNVSLDNQSMNNDAFNSKNFAHSIATGDTSSVTYEGAGNPSTEKNYGGLAERLASGALTSTTTFGSGYSTGNTASNGSSIGASAAINAAEQAGLGQEYNQTVTKGKGIVDNASQNSSLSQNREIGFSAGKALGAKFAAANTTTAKSELKAAASESVYNILSAAGFGSLFDTLTDRGLMGNNGAKVLTGLGKGEAPAQVAKDLGVNESAVTDVADEMDKLKSDPGLAAKAEGLIKGFASEVPAAAKDTLLAGGAVVGAVFGVDEVVGLGAIGVEGAEDLVAAEPEVASLLGSGEGAAEGTAESAATTAPEPTAEEPNGSRPLINPRRPGDTSIPTRIAQATGLGAQTNATNTQSHDVAHTTQNSATATQDNTSSQTAKRSTGSAFVISKGETVKSELNALATSGQKYSRQAALTLQRMNTISKQESALQTAAHNATVDRKTAIPLAANLDAAQLKGLLIPSTPGGEAEVHSGNPANLGKTKAAALGQLAQAHQATDNPLHLQSGGTLVGQTNGVTSAAENAASNANAKIAANPVHYSQTSRHLAALLKNQAKGVVNGVNGLNASEQVLQSQFGNSAGSLNSLFNANSHRLQNFENTVRHNSLLKTLGKADAIQYLWQTPTAITSQAGLPSNANTTMEQGEAQIYNRLFGGAQGRERLKAVVMAAEANHIAPSVLAGVLATESSGLSGTAASLTHGDGNPGDLVVGQSQVELTPAEMQANPELVSELQHHDSAAILAGATILAQKLQASGGNWNSALKAYSGGASDYATKVADFSEYFDGQMADVQKSLAS